MSNENKDPQKHDAKSTEGETQREKTGAQTGAEQQSDKGSQQNGDERPGSEAQPGKDVRPANAGNPAGEPEGMGEVPADASPVYRSEYANVLRDFHQSKLRNVKSQIVRELPEAQRLAAVQAAKVEAGGRPSAIS